MTLWKRPSLYCLGLVMLLPARSAHAEESPKAASEAAFRAGQRALEQGDTKTACERFRASLALEEALGTRLHLADCYEMDNRLASAWAAFKEAHSIALARGDEKRANLAAERAQLLEGRLPRIVITIAKKARVRGLKVRVGETEFPSGSWGVEIPIDAGVARVSGGAPGYAPFSREVVIPSEPKVVRVAVPELLPQVSANTRSPRARISASTQPAAGDALHSKDKAGDRAARNNQAVYGWIAAGAGLVGLGGGTYLGVRALEKDNDSKKLCRTEDTSLCTSEGSQLRAQAQDRATYATLSLAVGGALLLGGITLVLTAPVEEGLSAPTPLRVNAGFAKGLQMLTVEGTF